jgi:probable addiction module antidote protein
MSQFAKDAGLSTESPYRALSAEGTPSFATVLKVAKALGCARQPRIDPFSEILPTTD